MFALFALFALFAVFVHGKLRFTEYYCTVLYSLNHESEALKNLLIAMLDDGDREAVGRINSSLLCTQPLRWCVHCVARPLVGLQHLIHNGDVVAMMCLGGASHGSSLRNVAFIN